MPKVPFLCLKTAVFCLFGAENGRIRSGDMLFRGCIFWHFHGVLTVGSTLFAFTPIVRGHEYALFCLICSGGLQKWDFSPYPTPFFGGGGPAPQGLPTTPAGRIRTAVHAAVVTRQATMCHPSSDNVSPIKRQCVAREATKRRPPHDIF